MLLFPAAGTVPLGFDSFGSLTYFDIGYNQLNGSFLASATCAGGFTKMEQLRMSNNMFTAIPTGESCSQQSYALIRRVTFSVQQRT